MPRASCDQVWLRKNDCLFGYRPQHHGIRFVTFTEKDVARHHLVQEIIAAYERDDNLNNARDLLEKA